MLFLGGLFANVCKLFTHTNLVRRLQRFRRHQISHHAPFAGCDCVSDVTRYQLPAYHRRHRRATGKGYSVGYFVLFGFTVRTKQFIVGPSVRGGNGGHGIRGVCDADDHPGRAQQHGQALRPHGDRIGDCGGSFRITQHYRVRVH